MRHRSHQLETESRRAFEMLLPSAWVFHAVDGTVDYGHDGRVELFDEDGTPLGLTFYVQLKGTDSSGSNQWTFYVRRKTVSYWTLFAEPTMVVRYSSIDRSLRACWASDFASETAASRKFELRADQELGVHVLPRVVRDLTSLRRPSSIGNRDLNFVGRKAELDLIDARLSDGGLIALVGPPGMGKTSLATEVFYRHWRSRPSWFVSASRPGGLDIELAAGGQVFGVNPASHATPAETVAQLLTRLSQTVDWLLVIDDAANPSTLAGVLPPVLGGLVVVTSRNPGWHPAGSVLELESLSEEEALHLLQEQTERHDDVALPAIARRFGGLPIAVAQAGSLLAESGMSGARYLELCDADLTRMLTHGAAGGSPFTASIRVARNTLDDLTRMILEAASVLAPTWIPIVLIEHLVSVAAGFDDQWADLNPVDVEDSIAELRRTGLCSRSRHGIAVHPLVSEILAADLPHSAVADLRLQIALAMTQAIPGDVADAFDAAAVLRFEPHVAALLPLLEEGTIGLLPLAYSLNRVAIALAEVGRHLVASELLEASRHALMAVIDARILPEDLHNQAESQLASVGTNLSNHLRDQGRYAEAAELLAQAVRHRDTAHESGRDPHACIQFGALGQLYSAQGQLVSARDAFLEAFERASEAATTLHPSRMIAALADLVDVSTSLKDLDAAASYLEAHGAAVRTAYGTGSLEEAEHLIRRARFEGQLIGEFGDAHQSSSEALRIVRSHADVDEGVIALALSAHAFNEAQIGDIDLACRLMADAVEIRRGLQRHNRVGLAMCLGDYSMLLLQASRLDEAQDSAAESVEIFEEIAGYNPGELALAHAEHAWTLLAREEYADAIFAAREAYRCSQETSPTDPTFAVTLRLIEAAAREAGFHD